MTWRRWLSLGCIAAGVALAPQQVRAQAAPTGNHYGARSSDTGFMGGVTSSGGYSTSVPLDFPSARGGLPVPVHIVYGERGFGAAGLGWDVPLSYIQRDTTLTRRRPVDTASVAPQPREQLSVTLAGSRIDLIRTANACRSARRHRHRGSPAGGRQLGHVRREGPDVHVRPGFVIVG